MTFPPLISVIIPTCNRPYLAEQAALSVLSQDYSNLELILVHNGSNKRHQNHYSTLFERLKIEFPTKVSVMDFSNPWQIGLGPSRARNAGILISQGEYVAFCDDDDKWIDSTYLSRIAPILETGHPDILFADQASIAADGSIIASHWYKPKLLENYSKPTEHKAIHQVKQDYFFDHGGFPHLNCTIFRKKMIRECGAFDPSISYEEDLEFFHRIAGSSQSIFYYNKVVSQHMAPSIEQSHNASMQFQKTQKHLISFRNFAQLYIGTKNKKLRNFAAQSASYAAKHLAVHAYQEHDYHLSRRMSLTALSWHFNTRWFLYSIYLILSGWLRIFLTSPNHSLHINRNEKRK